MLLSNGTEICTFSICPVHVVDQNSDKWGIFTMQSPLQLGSCSMLASHRSRVHCRRKARITHWKRQPSQQKVGQRLFNVQTIRLRRSSIRQLRLSIFAGFKQSGIFCFHFNRPPRTEDRRWPLAPPPPPVATSDPFRPKRPRRPPRPSSAREPRTRQVCFP